MRSLAHHDSCLKKSRLLSVPHQCTYLTLGIAWHKNNGIIQLTFDLTSLKNNNLADDLMRM